MTSPRLPIINPSMAGNPYMKNLALCGVALENERRVGAAETEGVRQNGVDPCVVDALAYDRHALEFRIERLDMGAFADEAALHHQDRIDGFLHARRAQRMAGQRLRRRDERHLLAKHFTDRSHFLGI